MLYFLYIFISFKLFNDLFFGRHYDEERHCKKDGSLNNLVDIEMSSIWNCTWAVR